MAAKISRYTVYTTELKKPWHWQEVYGVISGMAFLVSFSDIAKSESQLIGAKPLWRNEQSVYLKNSLHIVKVYAIAIAM